MNANEYDVIIVGSGTGGATLARELSRQGRKILMLERGGDVEPDETLGTMARIANEVPVGNKLTAARVLNTGGSSSLYFGVVNYPPLEAFSAHGVDIAQDLEAVKAELPIAPLADALISAKAFKLRDAAKSLGHDWQKFDMLVDQSRCAGGYNFGALWRAREYVRDAVSQGTTLVKQANVSRILVDGGRATGVEYQLRKNMFSTGTVRAHAAKIVIAAGELATPKMLMDAGVPGIGRRGFYCNPGYALYGLVPALESPQGFVGSMGCTLDEGIELGDANVSKFLHRLMMLSKFKLGHMRGYAQAVGIGVKVKDEFGGTYGADGKFHKDFSKQDFAKLRKGEEAARKVLQQAGAQKVFNFGLTCAGRVGGTVLLGEHVDGNLETGIRDLHVCDGSILPSEMRGTPSVTLVALARYLSRRLVPAL